MILDLNFEADLDATPTTPALRCEDLSLNGTHKYRRPITTSYRCVEGTHEPPDRLVLQDALKLPIMAPTTLRRALHASAFICRDCLRTRPLCGHPQKRWLGTKYVAKLMKAEHDWAVQAEEISAGKRKNLFDELDERGFVKDILG